MEVVCRSWLIELELVLINFICLFFFLIKKDVGEQVRGLFCMFYGSESLPNQFQ